MAQNDTTTPKVLTYALLGALLGIEITMFFLEVPVPNKELFNNIIQTILTLTVAAVTFYVGSSASSKAKDEKPTQPIAEEPKP